ncbi:MAG: HAMP domain-containing histidine kinase [Acidimicrobiia bacterium]|nr:HAMP domain-containing histidine kinase [Acidimicrobiia bacterium]
MARAALRPVHQLTETAEEVTRTLDLARRIDVAGRDELARLAASFNTMLAALQASVDAQRQLVADASHELRTPLTSLRTNVDVLARADELDPEERDRLRRDVDGQIAELAGLVGDVIELAREGEPVRVTEDVRLDELVAMAVEQAAFHWPQARFDTDLDPVTVRGVPERLERAVANLLDNAGKWSPPDAPVEVTVRGRELVVRDHGPGVAPGDATHVFDRFWRSPAARDLPGSGLGLSIVRQVADSHGATVSVEPAPGGGALFRLRFPDP